jgi:hypothetical protein
MHGAKFEFDNKLKKLIGHAFNLTQDNIEISIHFEKCIMASKHLLLP